jgi:nucleoid-associated protein YgaU
VQPGESLRTIAAMLLGDEKRWPEIFDINRDRLQSPDLLRVGQELRVRNPRPIHVVQLGETLGSIAALFLGDAGRWREIFEANRDRIQNPDRIRVGQRLVIPLPSFDQ